MFQNGLATCDDLRGRDEALEAANGECYDITECIVCGEQGLDENTVLLARLHPTYKVPYSSSGIKDASPRTPHRRITKVDPAARSPEVPAEVPDTDIVPQEPTECKIGHKYLPSKLSDHQGPYFAHDKAELSTLVLVVVSLATYVIKDQKLESGVSLPDKRIYHVLIDRLRVLDRSDAGPWDPPVPEIPEARAYSPMTPQCRARDDAADTAGSKSSPSTPKRARRAGAGSS
ncbi:hypothetical protein DFH07DRAFT_1029589 [Mycena maculata]|uniref:Uncharacterized protein n=1 Tax=Mycena maculata TaxID=230809 RepID=A0AAD7NCN4_9AGAR|nr:hypothetical protein DFH07DRAFT_1029589 [Mycena maculata]